MSDEFRFSFLIKKNKIHSLGNLSLKNSKLNSDIRESVIQKYMNESSFKDKDTLIQKVKIYSLIQSICSLLSIILSIIDI